MTTRAPARPGDPLADVDTPALLLDLRTFEANVAAMQAWCDGQGITVRPHAKSHKCAAIAAYQMGRGAVGVCAQKVSETEALVHAGVSDVLVSNQIVGVAKARRLAALAKLATIGVCVD
ncbi:MAG: DSD1 family PLP-dependent enzyme, partial [Pseudomonadota bacterium]